MDAPTYEIKTVADFLKVPEDRWDACLKEFKDFLYIAKRIKGFADELASVVGADATKNTVEAFEWIDDGANKVHIGVTLTEDEAAK